MGLFGRRRTAPTPSSGPAPVPFQRPGGYLPPPDDAAPPSDAVQRLARFALDHALRSVVPEGGPLVPFALLEGEGRALHRFVGDLVEGQQQARDDVRTSAGARGAVAWDGYLTVEGQRQDAVFVEASDRGCASILLAQRYHDAPGRSHGIGEPVAVGRGAPLL